jgi:uncharacterized damage-inducible protein DinB
MGISEALLPELDREMTIVRKVLERAPDGRFSWRPHAKSFSLGELVSHIAHLPTWGAETLNMGEIDIGTSPRPAELGSTAAVIATFDANVAAMRAALVGTSDNQIMTIWTLKRNGKVLFSMPKAVVLRSFVLSHVIHHRGQLSVYLRLLDVPVPSMYGPSADEPAF